MSTARAKLFKVTKKVLLEWGQTEHRWIKFFFAEDKKTVETHVVEHYGPLCLYYNHDRCEEVTTIEEVEYESL